MFASLEGLVASLGGLNRIHLYKLNCNFNWWLCLRHFILQANELLEYQSEIFGMTFADDIESVAASEACLLNAYTHLQCNKMKDNVYLFR